MTGKIFYGSIILICTLLFGLGIVYSSHLFVKIILFFMLTCTWIFIVGCYGLENATPKQLKEIKKELKK